MPLPDITPQQIAKLKVASSWDKMLALQKGKFNPDSEVATDSEDSSIEINKSKDKFKIYRKDFIQKYKVSYAAFSYWLKKILANEIDAKDLPEKYKPAYRGYLITKYRKD